MNSKVEKANGIVEALRKTHLLVLNEIEQMDQMLTNLRFEGKSNIGRNLKQVQEAVGFLKSKLCPHMDMEERSLFPFLRAHLPKLESVIHLLCSEHQDFKQNLANLESVVKEFLGLEDDGARGKLLESIREKAIYLVYLLRHHIQAEEISVYEVACRELRPEEKAELARLAA